jgi:hypothetical protein
MKLGLNFPPFSGTRVKYGIHPISFLFTFTYNNVKRINQTLKKKGE